MNPHTENRTQTEVFENKVVGKIFVVHKEEVTGK
jgi:hypothetical protein